MSQLTLDHDQRNFLVRHFNGVGMGELMRREAASNAAAGGRVVQLFAGS